MEQDIKTMDDIKEEIDKTISSIKEDDILKGTVIEKKETFIIVDIGYHTEGIINLDELSFDPQFNLEKDILVGDEINVKVLNIDDEEGYVVLSKKKADIETAWEIIEDIYNNKKVITVRVNNIVKGGVITYINGIRGFIPASLLSVNYVENLNEYVGKELDVKIKEFKQEDKKLILSAKEVEKEQIETNKINRLKELKKGEQVEGIVKKLQNYGAFVDIGGIDGLIRNQDLAWVKVKHPSEILKEGQQVKVTILDVNIKNQKLSLALKDISQNPWLSIEKDYKKDDIVEGQVTKLVDFGAFVALKNGVEGLVHISEISESRIQKVSDVLSVDDKVKVKILNIDKKNKKISLSIKQVQHQIDIKEMNSYVNEDDSEGLNSLKDVFAVFKDQLK